LLLTYLNKDIETNNDPNKVTMDKGGANKAAIDGIKAAEFARSAKPDDAVDTGVITSEVIRSASEIKDLTQLMK
jgi:hypothetical protein